MTVEELKVEAAKLGYYLIKKPDKYIPCTCGANSRRFRWINNKPTLTCSGCGYRFTPDKEFTTNHIHGVISKMRDLWNAEMIKKEEENERIQGI